MTLRRDLGALANGTFDLAVVGGGIFGASAAWDAVLRGLKVALVEKWDFAHATSANSFKMVHGGVRYLQHLDIRRIRQSSRERRALLRVAPHLVEPLPIVIPTYGHGISGKELLGAGLLAYDLLVADRNRGIRDPERRIPRSRLVSRKEALRLFPNLPTDGLTGGALFHDAQMYNPTRLALSFVRAAAERGATVANYAQATRFLRRGDRVEGIEVRDRLGEDTFALRARVVLNAAGPWAEDLLARGLGSRLERASTFSRDTAFVIDRQISDRFGIALQGRTTDPDAVLSRAARHLFVVPWRDYSLVGVWHGVHPPEPERVTVREEELESYIEEINQAYPGLGLSLDDVTMWNAGLVLFGENEPGAEHLRYGHRSRLVDHRRAHGVDGLITLIGVRYTVARSEAEKAVTLAFEQLGRKAPRSRTEVAPVFGGEVSRMRDLEASVRAWPGRALSPGTVRSLTRNYGSEHGRILRYVERDPELGETIGSSDVLRAEVVHAAREEMAVRLADVVLRRTELGTGAHPGVETIQDCARLMAAELDWSTTRGEEEEAELLRFLDGRTARTGAVA